jgi:hypothetical protein
MKSFGQFIKEAVETSASRQAKLMNLVGDGHGDWYDAKGNLVAKTVQGKLKFFGAGGAPQEDPQQEKQQVAQEPLGKKPVSAQEPEAEKKDAGGIVIVFGRFNPPTIGHGRLLDAAAREAKRTNSELKIYPSRTQDAKKNPLDPGIKINYMRQMFPNYKEQIVNDSEAKTIFDVLTNAYGDGYSNATIMVGQDRLSEFQGLAQKYNGSEMYDFENIVVLSGGARDPDSEGVSGMSASKMRSYAADGNYQAFAKGIPDTLKPMQKRELYSVVRRSMDINEETELWEIAPKLNMESLRESYVNGSIFNIGDIVENLNTGMVGKIIRRGTNHIICLTENGMMFKSWLRDIKEYTEVKMDRMMREPGKPNTLVGTTGFFKYVSKMTPGAIKTNSKFLAKGQKAYTVKK